MNAKASIGIEVSVKKRSFKFRRFRNFLKEMVKRNGKTKK